MGKRKGNFRRDPENIKRFRAIIEKFVEDAGQQQQTNKPKVGSVTNEPGTGQSESIPQARRKTVQNKTDSGTFKNRKLRRREERKLKKVKQLAYHQRKHVPSMEEYINAKKSLAVEKRKVKQEEKKKEANVVQEKEKETVKKKKDDVRKHRLVEANKQDERIVKQIEKQMKMKKKQKLPKGFLDDGLDYILDAISSDKLYSSYDQSSDEEGGPEDSNKEDIVKAKKEKEQDSDSQENTESDEDEDDEMDFEQLSDDSDESESNAKPITVIQEKVPSSKSILKPESQETSANGDNSKKSVSFGPAQNDRDEDMSDNENSSEDHSKDSDIMSEEIDNLSEQNSDNDEDFSDEEKSIKDTNLKEDIYGRLRDDKGNLIPNPPSTGAYIPPAKRLQMAEGNDPKRQQKLDRLRKQLKGLVNRTSEANIQPISIQIEEIFRTNSRADVSESLCNIVMEACVSTAMTPDRLVMELVMLIAILHGNVGPEVGACFLQNLAKQFHTLRDAGSQYGEGKEMDNVISLLTHLYNFKVIHSQLLFDILRIFTDSFKEKDIELILLVLKNVGFSLRKDDASALKDLIVEIQGKAGSVDTSEFVEKSRVKFMLEIIMAVRNNNMRKIPNYDPTHLEHLRKLIRSYVKGGKIVDNQLRISLSDLLQAENSGRWWLVGSAWSGGLINTNTVDEKQEAVIGSYISSSSVILEKARKQRMNTDTRKTIFCTIMASEDFVDAFEKLLRLGLKHKQERELVYVTVDCCCQEKKFNPFYPYLLQKFCEYDRRFQMTFQFHLWDKFSSLSDLSEQNLCNLAGLLKHLLATKAISLSILKTVEFGTLEKPMVKFLKLVLQGILLDYPDHVTSDVFSRIAPLTKLHLLHEGLKLFMQHFLLKSKKLTDSEHEKLSERIKLAEKSISAGQPDQLL